MHHDSARDYYLAGIEKELGIEQPVDAEAAAQLYRRAALRGLPEAQHALGTLYELGQGVAHNPVIAAQWLHRAATGGYAPEQRDLTSLYPLIPAVGERRWRGRG